MRYGRNYPQPETNKSEATSVRSTGSSGNSTGLSLVTYNDLTIMVWNIANLGGGFGVDAERDQAIIDSIARTITAANADICIVLEIKRHSQPPARPRIYPPREVHMPRVLFPDPFEGEIASLAEAFRLHYASNGAAGRFYGTIYGTFVFSSITKTAYDEGGGTVAQRQNMAAAIRWNLVQVAWQVTRGEARGEFISLQRCRTYDRYTGELPDFVYDYYFDDDTVISELHELSDVTEWFHEIEKPAVKQLPRYDAGRLTACYELLSNIHANFLTWVHRRFARNLFRLSRDPTEGELDLCQTLFQSYYANLQHEHDDSDRRERLYQQKRAAWEASRKKTHHPGIREFLRILGSLSTASSDIYDGWPARHDPDDKNVNGETDERTVAEKDLSNQILYTEGESYGILFRTSCGFIRTKLRLRSVTRIGAFRKRAPFVFGLALGDQNFNIIAWHAPSDSASNAPAREASFALFAELPHRIARITMEPTVSVGDFNIDTATSSAIRNAGKTAFNAQELFSAIFGHADFPTQSFFWNLRTSLKRFVGFRFGGPSPFDLRVGTDRYDILSCAFDKICAYWPSCVGWLVRSETVVPLPYLLASNLQSNQLPDLSFEDGSDHPLGLVPIDMFGLRGKLDTLSRKSDTSSWLLAGRLLDLTRLMSDHLPILTRFSIPSTGSTRNFESIPVVLAKSIDDPVARSASEASGGYRNIGGGDCLFHAVLHRLTAEQQTALGITPTDALLTRIQALRNLAAAEIRAHPGRYNGFLRSGQSTDQAATQIGTMTAWNNFAGDLAPLAIANAIGRSFQIHRTNTGRNITIHSAAHVGTIAALNYNGFDHYW